MPPPSSAAARPAADGHDVSACADADCEIAVSQPLTVRFKGPGGPTTLSVTEVGPDKAEFTVKGGNGRSRAGANGEGSGCVTVLSSNGSSTSCGGAPGARPTAEPGTVVIQIATGQDGTAILQIASR
ncbi:hypothetical protein ACFVTY_10920 [Streptomyces sp. NPDC058067]|uniref:hypothetical protein n=1 Tax=Streptomyces sp. NPDC058067 TaxID=3346324 RepID=UPI0036E15E53